jgi:phosphoribosylaminoimidazolecarboxamide formyltransferase/IMP cyclohydrolase
MSAPQAPWECAYGENAWQAPARLLHTSTGEDPLAIGAFTQLEGAAPSYNNLAELDRQLQTVTHIAAALDVAGIGAAAIAVGTKHGNACGAGIADDLATAVERMLTGDLRAIFGGCVMVCGAVDAKIAEVLLGHACEGRRLLDMVAAASFTPEAVAQLARKQGKCRLLANPALAELSRASLDTSPRQRQVRGGVLQQPNYTYVLDLADPELFCHGELSPDEHRDLLLAWAVGSTSNSNTVTLVRDGRLLGNGVGQQDRVGGCSLAIWRAREAGHDLTRAVAFSDSFFPFPDAAETLIAAGVGVIFSTSGSVRDELVRERMIAAGVTVVQLPDRVARGFFGH